MSTFKRIGIALFLMVVVAAAGAYVYRTWQIGLATPAPEYQVPVPYSVPEASASPELAVDDETRRLAMQGAYADLEMDRLLLNRQLGALNAKLWGRRLPAARVQSMQTDMMAAKKLLTNPPLLGAFLDVEGIQHERDRVQAARARLERIDSEFAAGE